MSPSPVSPSPGRIPAAVAAPSPEVLRLLPAGSWVAVVRLRSLGDIVLTTPAVAALKHWRPDLRLAYLAEPRWTAALEGNPEIERIIPVPGNVAGRLAAAAQLRALRPSLVAALHRGAAAAALTWASGARWRVGYQGLRHGWALNVAVPPRPAPPGRRRWHTAEHVAALFESLGMPAADLGPARIFPGARAQAAVAARLRAAGSAGPYVFLNVFPREPAMRWPAAGYQSLAPWLRQRLGWAAVMAHPARRPGSEDQAVSAVLQSAGAALLAPTSLADLIALIAGAEMVVGSDGGPLHLAAALGKPVVALFGPTDVDTWAPWRTPHRLLAAPATAVAWDEVRQAIEALAREVRLLAQTGAKVDQAER